MGKTKIIWELTKYLENNLPDSFYADLGKMSEGNLRILLERIKKMRVAERI